MELKLQQLHLLCHGVVESPSLSYTKFQAACGADTGLNAQAHLQEGSD